MGLSRRGKRCGKPGLLVVGDRPSRQPIIARRADQVRVVFVGSFGLYPKGTMRARAVPLARELRRLGHEVVVVIPPWDYPPHSGKTLFREGVPVINLQVSRNPPAAWYLPTALAL